MADESGIIGEIVETAGDIAGAVGGELKKLGQSATSQVTGQTPSMPVSSDQLKASVKTQVSGLGDSSDSSVWDGFKKIFETAGSQVTGHEAPIGHHEIKEMAKRDEQFSNQEQLEIKAKIQRIYDEYAAKKKNQLAQQQQITQEQEAKSKQVEELDKEKKQESLDVAVAQAKAKAEVKNYGAE